MCLRESFLRLDSRGYYYNQQVTCALQRVSSEQRKEDISTVILSAGAFVRRGPLGRSLR